MLQLYNSTPGDIEFNHLILASQYSAKLSAISDARGEDAAYIDPGGVLAAGTDSSPTYFSLLALLYRNLVCSKI